jgi:hypothetical protein
MTMYILWHKIKNAIKLKLHKNKNIMMCICNEAKLFLEKFKYQIYASPYLLLSPSLNSKVLNILKLFVTLKATLYRHAWRSPIFTHKEGPSCFMIEC